jgi:hypothetical protein
VPGEAAFEGVGVDVLAGAEDGLADGDGVADRVALAVPLTPGLDGAGSAPGPPSSRLRVQPATSNSRMSGAATPIATASRRAARGCRRWVGLSGTDIGSSLH